MKQVLPVLAAVLFAAACDDPTTIDPTMASVRFFNATTGMTRNGGFTTNGQFATGSGGTLHATNMAAGSPTTFTTMASGSNAFTVLHGHETALSGSAATLDLPGGSVNTLAIVRNTSRGFELINLPRCS